MDSSWIRQVKPSLTRYLNRFSNCFSRKDIRARLPTYVQSQLSDFDRKSVKPLALAADGLGSETRDGLSSRRQERLRQTLNTTSNSTRPYVSSTPIAPINNYGKSVSNSPP